MRDLTYPPIIATAKVAFKLLGLRFDMRGTEHVPRSGGALLVYNHVSYVDFILGGLAANPSGRLVRFMAKREVFDHRWTGPVMRSMHHIAVDRAEGVASYDEGVRVLRAGEIVGIFPEATISRSFELKEFKTGAARMAIDAQVPIIPLIVWGAHRRWTKDHPRRLVRGKIPFTVVVGAPVPPAENVAQTDAAMREAMTVLLHRAQESYEHPEGAYWVPRRMGGSAPTLDEAKVLDEAELAERARREQQA